MIFKVKVRPFRIALFLLVNFGFQHCLQFPAFENLQSLSQSTLHPGKETRFFKQFQDDKLSYLESGLIYIWRESKVNKDGGGTRIIYPIFTYQDNFHIFHDNFQSKTSIHCIFECNLNVFQFLHSFQHLKIGNYSPNSHCILKKKIMKNLCTRIEKKITWAICTFSMTVSPTKCALVAFLNAVRVFSRKNQSLYQKDA